MEKTKRKCPHYIAQRMSLSYYENSFDSVGPLEGSQRPLGGPQTTLWESLLQVDMQINRTILPVY